MLDSLCVGSGCVPVLSWLHEWLLRTCYGSCSPWLLRSCCSAQPDCATNGSSYILGVSSFFTLPYDRVLADIPFCQISKNCHSSKFWLRIRIFQIFRDAGWMILHYSPGLTLGVLVKAGWDSYWQFCHYHTKFYTYWTKTFKNRMQTELTGFFQFFFFFDFSFATKSFEHHFLFFFHNIFSGKSANKTSFMLFHVKTSFLMIKMT